MVRQATIDDVEDLIRLRMALVKEANHLDETEDISELQNNIAAYLRENISGNILAWLVEDAGEIVAASGMNLFQKPPTYVNPTGKEAFIMNIYVEPSSRGKGYATCLVNEMIAYLKNTEYKKVSLVATEAGKSVYEKIGFKMKDGVMEYSL